MSLKEILEEKEQRTMHNANKERLRLEKLEKDRLYKLNKLHATESYKAEQWKRDILNGRK